MARIVRVFKTLRNHWKKSTFGFLLLSYGADYGYGKFQTHEMIKSYCEEAKRYGDVPLPIGSSVRQITVILNPASNARKGVNDFEKYCAPLLYLSGMKVSVVKTESIGEARGLMGVMDNCDAVVVAGGDGALAEAVTGLFRRSDGSFAAQRFPIGIIPVGKTNGVAKSLFKDCQDDRIRLMAEATMAIVRDIQRHVDVMKIEVIEEGPEQPERKGIYAPGGIKWGPFRDVDERVGKYWIWGPLRAYAAYVFCAFKDLTWNCEAKFRYTLPCDGCKNCSHLRNFGEMNQTRGPQQARWWHAFIPRTKTTSEANPVKDYSQIDNPDCGVWHQKDFSCVEFRALTENNVEFEQPNQPKHLEVLLGPEDIGTFQFIREGWGRNRGSSPSIREKIVVQQFEMIPQVQEKAQDEISNKEDPAVEKWYSIDNDNYEVKPVRVTILPQAIKMFAPYSKASA